jgi:hypothetical protein
MKHLITIDGSIEDSCFLFIYRMLFLEILQLTSMSLTTLTLIVETIVLKICDGSHVWRMH